MKITYKMYGQERVSFNYKSAEALINSFRSNYGEAIAAQIEIVKVESPTLKEKIAVSNVGAKYFEKFGTACE